MNKVKFLLIYLFLSFITISCTYTRPNSNIFEPLTSGEPIPKGFSTYTLFLVPSYYLKKNYTEKQWNDLLVAFKTLGSSIGKQNIAIWFFNADKKTPNIERSRSIIDKINFSDTKNQHDKLSYEMAPIIVFMNYNPELEPTDSSQFYTALQLNGKDPKMIIKFMDELTQLIRNEKINFGTLERKQMVIGFDELLSKVNLGDVINIFTNLKPSSKPK